VGTAAGRLTATHILDATGARRWLSRRLRIPATSFSPRLVARYGYSSRPSDFGSIPRFQEHRGGWTWLARVRDEYCQCVRLALAPESELPAIPESFGFPPRLRGADVSWRVVERCAGPGYFLCGDAAATLDPAATSGVARAMASGMKAADLIVEIAAGDIDEIDAVRSYREWLGREFRGEMVRLASRYSAFENAPRWIRELEERVAAETRGVVEQPRSEV
jgi:2-polyprenyl-6-methoxyphenol hydroxylase-like FAD-dependent oxidoreductase